jgi:diguanylate cyclase (GGDEF)-like protein
VPTAGGARNAAGAAAAQPGSPAQEGQSWIGWVAALLAMALGAAALAFAWSRRRGGAHGTERADVDALTGLPNLLAFEERFADEWRRARRYGRPLGVVLLGLEGLQSVNDRRGPAAGDRLICAAADQIQDHIRTCDLGARLTGDKFAVLCPETQPAGLKRLSDKLTEQLETAGIGVTAGWAQLSDRDAAPADLLARAHAATYQAQDPGRRPMARPDLATAG